MLLPHRFLARSGARYHGLPTPQTRPIDPGAPSTITLPIVTNPPDQTKNHRVLHVESPTKPYRILCSRCETHWCVWFGHGALTRPYQLTVLAVDHYNIVLPIITGRGVKYTHNDHRNPTVPTHSGGPGLGLVHPGRHPSLEVIR
jgi:hypothetical protein